MSNETKRDVFDALMADMSHGSEQWRARYDAALPDDLPVIPKAVGDVIVKLKHKEFSLFGAMSYAAVVSLSAWMAFENEEAFALAWVLGIWRVEETGEILKFEAEK